jgi:hypothetical protein
MRHGRFAALAVLFILALTFAAQARVISYAPYSDRASIPGTQSRTSRHFVVFEQTSTAGFYGNPGEVVLYDSTGEEEPRVVFPKSGSANINALALREEPGQPAQILINASSAPNVYQWLFSSDGGDSWKPVALPPFAYSGNYYLLADVGGPFTHARGGNLRIGTREMPFVVALQMSATSGAFVVSGVAADGSVKTLATVAGSPSVNVLAGSDRSGRRFLARDGSSLIVIDTVTASQMPLAAFSNTGYIEGWLTSDGTALVEQFVTFGDDTLWNVKNGVVTRVDGASARVTPALMPIPGPGGTVQFFAVPTSDDEGAWIVERPTGQPTVLALYTPARGIERQWSDLTAPEVEAVHAGASGKKLLIQVHRQRQTVDAMLFKDPALAVWNMGDPAPRFYDELFLSESGTKGFVHLDVDAIESGAPFVFDSGIQQNSFPPLLSPPPPSSSGGGSDVVQEWGVVRASLLQKLVLPGVGRTPGAYGSYWMSDVTFYNPSDAPSALTVEYRPSGEVTTADIKQARILLGARQVITVVDSLKALFKTDVGVGAYFITPDPGSSVNVTSRTYTTSPKGTYGYGMNAIDIFAATGPRFPVTFSGAFQGSDFRTNAVLTDVSGRGSELAFAASGPFGAIGSTSFSARAPRSGVQQINGVQPALSLSSASLGALTVQPRSGEAIASIFTVDNRTNDPTFFPPDLAASVVRVIPAIAHLDGANNSKFRSDLYLFNNSASPKQLNIQLRMWDGTGPTNLGLTLLPFEARVIPDVLATAFGQSGIGRLRVWSIGSTTDPAVRVTSRTYTVDANGGTYGFLMPPLNSFQEAAPGDTLELIGPALDPRFRTNLGLVDIAAFPSAKASVRVEIFDDGGKQLDKFETSLPAGGGTQLNDLFHARGLPDSGAPVVIRVTALSGMVGAYAASNDNGTNDPTYVAASLAAKQ